MREAEPESVDDFPPSPSVRDRSEAQLDRRSSTHPSEAMEFQDVGNLLERPTGASKKH